MSLNTLEAAKQAARQALAVAGDKYRLATATLTRAETQVRVWGGGRFVRGGAWGCALARCPGNTPLLCAFSARLARDQTSQRDGCRRVGAGGRHQAKTASGSTRAFPRSRPDAPHTASHPFPQDLDVAIIKATTPATHVVPKDKHVRTLRSAVGAGAPRAQVAYVNGELLARLRGAADWLVSGLRLCVCGRGDFFFVFSFSIFLTHPPLFSSRPPSKRSWSSTASCASATPPTWTNC